MDSLRLLGNFVTAAVLRTEMKEAHCVKTQAVNKQMASLRQWNGGLPYTVQCRIPFLAFFAIFRINLETTLLKLHTNSPRGFKVVSATPDAHRRGDM
jgi:hypothetical protein